MKKIVWKLQFFTTPSIYRYCKKCGKKIEFIPSNQFRVNAQRRYLDIWLIYKCVHCDTTWNAEIFSRISPRSLEPELLQRFYNNDEKLLEEYAMNMEFLHKNGVQNLLPDYSVMGEVFNIGESIELEIKSDFALPIKVSTLVRKKLKLSQKVFSNLIEEEKVTSVEQKDLRKCKLHNGIVLIFQ